jgi:Protein of unknown function (DUF3788)
MAGVSITDSPWETRMAIGVFVDKEHKPTAAEIAVALGSKRPLWENLNGFIADSYVLKSDFAFYGKNYGWALRFRKGGKVLLSLYPDKDSFTAQIIIGQEQAEKALGLGLSKRVNNIIEDAHPYPEGRWLFVKVDSEQDLNDVKQLLMVKSQPVHKNEQPLQREIG